MNTPLNDAWILEISNDLTRFSWTEFNLPYDHGGIRCLHSATCLQDGSEIIIHSGCTQEFYTNRLELDNHEDSILRFSFGVKSLLRLCIEFVEKNFPSEYLNYNSELIPNRICEIFFNRRKSVIEERRYPASDDFEMTFSKSILLAGL